MSEHRSMTGHSREHAPVRRRRGRGRRWFRKKRFLIPLAIVVVLVGYGTWDFYPPRRIPLEDYQVWGLRCRRARDLVVQEHDEQGNLWATRGMWAYRLKKDDDKFVRRYHIPTGPSIYWLRNFSLVRWLTGKTECVELLPRANGQAVAMSAGHMWYRAGPDEDFEKTFTLRHYGYGVGSGVRSGGICRLADGNTIVFGEYWYNRGRTDVRLYSSTDGGRTWRTAYAFPAGRIRHVHGVQQDTETGHIWVCTGDSDAQSLVAWSADGFKSLHIVGEGRQRWRACAFQFTEDAVYWGTDTPKLHEAGVYRYDRSSGEVTKVAPLSGCVLYGTRLGGGLLVWNVDREGTAGETDDKTRLRISPDGKESVEIVCDTLAKGARFKQYAYMRLARDQGVGSYLAGTCRSVKEEHNEDLLIIPEQELRRIAARARRDGRPEGRSN